MKSKKLLEERFREKYVVSNAWINEISQGPHIKLNDREAQIELADDLEIVKSIAPVKVKGRGKDKVVTTYALVDNGSTSSGALKF